jgi:hypothetical protein
VDKRSASTISLAAGMLLVGGQPNLELLGAMRPKVMWSLTRVGWAERERL